MLKLKNRDKLVVGHCPFCGPTFIRFEKKPFTVVCSICSYPLKELKK